MAVETLGIEFVTAGFAAIDNQLKTLSGKIDEVGASSQKTGSIVENTLAVALGNVLARAAETAASALLKMGQAAIGAVASAGKAVLDFGVEATLSAARVSEMSAVLNLLGERAGWTKGAIDENVEAMRNLGIRTDVAIDTLAAFARENLNAADALMVARVAQDLAVLSGRDSSEVLGELIYGIQTQNSGLQVFSDLGIQAGAAMDTYAKSMTKTVEVAAIVGGRTAEQNQHLKIAQSAYKSATAAIYKHNAGISTLSDKALANAIAKQGAANAEMTRLGAITGTATTVTKTLTGASKELTKELTKSERMQAMVNAVRERGATIEGVYATAMKEPGKALRSLPRLFYEATISIGEHFLPVLGHVVEAITGFIKSIREMLAEGEPLNKMFAALGKLGATLAKALGVELGNGFEGLVDAMIPAIERVTEIIDAIRAFFLLAQN